MYAVKIDYANGGHIEFTAQNAYYNPDITMFIIEDAQSGNPTTGYIPRDNVLNFAVQDMKYITKDMVADESGDI